MKQGILLFTGILVLSTGCRRSLDDLAELTAKVDKTPVFEYVVQYCNRLNDGPVWAEPQTVEYIFVRNDADARLPFYYRIEDAGGTVGMYFAEHYVETRPEDKSAWLFSLKKDSGYFRAVQTFPPLEHSLPFVLSRFEIGLQTPGVIDRMKDTVVGETEIRRFGIEFRDTVAAVAQQVRYELWIDRQTKTPFQYSVRLNASFGMSQKHEERLYRFSSFTLSEASSKPLDLSSLPTDFSVNEYQPDLSFGITVF